jgi:hypothetical protein
MEFEIKDQQYRAEKLDCFKQLKLSLKLTPLLASIAKEYGVLRDVFNAETFKKIRENTVDPKDFSSIFESVLPSLAEKMASLPESDIDAITGMCLAVVRRKTAGNWAAIYSNGSLMFDDIDMLVMLRIVGKVAWDNLGNFFPAPPISQTPGNPHA